MLVSVSARCMTNFVDLVILVSLGRIARSRESVKGPYATIRRQRDDRAKFAARERGKRIGAALWVGLAQGCCLVIIVSKYRLGVRGCETYMRRIEDWRRRIGYNPLSTYVVGAGGCASTGRLYSDAALRLMLGANGYGLVFGSNVASAAVDEAGETPAPHP